MDGTGVTIAICDTGVDTNVAATVPPDLAGRLAFAVAADTGTPLTGGDTDGHGTHVAGIAAGNNGSGALDPQGFGLGQGLAPAARVGSVVFNGTRQQRIERSVRNGATVMNNSWSMDGSAYGAGERTFDLSVRDADPASADLEQLVVVFSTGLVVVTGEHAVGPQPVQVLDRLRKDQVQALGVFTRRPAARRRARSGCSRVLGAEESTGRAEPGSPR